MSLSIRPMSRADLEVALGWARAEGWNPGLDDVGPFHAQDPTGFLMGWLGTVRVGCISVVKYGTGFAFMGLYIVLPAFRGKGYGKALLMHLVRLAKHEGCGRMEWSVLNWNAPAIAFYESLGAVPMKEWTVYRLDEQGIAGLSAR